MIELSGRSEGRSSVSAIWEVTEGHTGRKVRGNDSYRLVVEWARLENREELLAHPSNELLRSLVAQAPLVSDASIILFRGRGIAGAPPTSKDMGPPRMEDTVRDGRYNKEGERVLYLSDSEEGVRCELRELDGKVLYLQQYEIPAGELHIADFTSLPADHFLTAVFSKAEERNVAGSGSKHYVFSQTVAEVVRERFGGMRVPGVQGKPGAWYCNVVIFHPYPDWPKWLRPKAHPYPLARDPSTL